jgi:site-specific recombinase XerD
MVFLPRSPEARAKRAVRRGADEVLKLVTGRALEGDSLQSYAEGWLQTRGEVAGPSIAKYETAIHRFLEMLGTRADLDLQAIEQKDVLFFRDRLAERLAASSVNSDLKIIRSMFTAAERDLLLTRNPARLVRALKVHDMGRERRSFTLAELGRIYAAGS